MTDKPTAVYEILDGDQVIYVGSGVNPSVRFADHRAKGKLPDGAALRIVRWYDTRKEARQAETKSIAEKSPRLNFVGRTDMTKKTGLVVAWKAELERVHTERARRKKAAIDAVEREINEHVAAHMPKDAGPWKVETWERGEYVVKTESGQVFRIPQ